MIGQLLQLLFDQASFTFSNTHQVYQVVQAMLEGAF